VTVLERTNVRALEPECSRSPRTWWVADLSFISLRLVLPALVRCAAPGARFVLLVKPQFEAGPGGVGPGGVVRDPAVWSRVLEDVAAAARASGLGLGGIMPSPLPGPAGNVEFLVAGALGADDVPSGPAIATAVDEAARLAGSAAQVSGGQDVRRAGLVVHVGRPGRRAGRAGPGRLAAWAGRRLPRVVRRSRRGRRVPPARAVRRGPRPGGRGGWRRHAPARRPAGGGSRRPRSSG
jgi:hypothetical protein